MEAFAAPDENAEDYEICIGGQWTGSSSGRWIESYNPSVGRPWARVPRCGKADVDRAVHAAREAFTSGEWPGLTASKRGALLRRLGDLWSEHADRLAHIETLDTGKRLADAKAQIRGTAEWFHYFAGLADKVEGAVLPLEKPGIFNYTRYEPLGVIVAITPWNAPLWLMAWKIAPALAAGNTVVVKPSEHASVSTLAFMKLVEMAGFPPGVINAVTGLGDEVGQPLITHPDVTKISFTGSDKIGQRIYELAAKSMKRITLELGGKSPNIVFEDADLEAAAKGVCGGIFLAAGQTCVAGSRLLVQQSVHDTFVARLVELARTARVGDPLDDATHIGPIATQAQHEKVLQYIALARTEGATCALGSKPAPADGGWFVEPTIFIGVTNRMRFAREEIFGPVLAVIPFTDEAEAISMANDSEFGLAAGVWTRDTARLFRVSEKLQAGTIYNNMYRGVSYMSPVGGYKRSGIGRENGAQAIKDYLQVKSIWLSLEAGVPDPFPT